MKPLTLEAPWGYSPPVTPYRSVRSLRQLRAELAAFAQFGHPTEQQTLLTPSGAEVPVFINEFWTAKQRAAHSLHEVSYRACFKPQLPRFFIQRLTQPGDLVYDPFMGRGTTLLEATLLNRSAAGCDINPVSRIFAASRLAPVTADDVAERLATLNLKSTHEVWTELEVFYHHDTLQELTALRTYLLARERAGTMDSVDRWIQMVATNRLTGHSSGFFSVYTLPPNQAITLESQRRINVKRKQQPPYREVKKLILRKTCQLLSDYVARNQAPTFQATPRLLTRSCDHTPELADDSVTSSSPRLPSSIPSTTPPTTGCAGGFAALIPPACRSGVAAALTNGLAS